MSAITVYRLEFVIERLAQTHSLVGCREGEGLSISIQARVGDQLEFLEKPQGPQRRDIGADLGRGRTLFDRNHGGASAADLVGETLLAQFAA